MIPSLSIYVGVKEKKNYSTFFELVKKIKIKKE